MPWHAYELANSKMKILLLVIKINIECNDSKLIETGTARCEQTAKKKIMAKVITTKKKK